ncbi:MAG: LamG domain-containing protein, partial [Bacteroidetes bacterium]|nr:LamG domain-containing protein [Bacteroidota bacterium]MBU1483495.1 LamG domain-containing protein [Bacteroidota bacterium]
MTVIVKSLTIILSLLTIQTFAQTYPITSITISLPANPDANTANWGSGTSLFTITANAKAANGRVDGHVAESKILVTIKKGGAKVCGSFTANSAPASNFNTLTKVWSGSNAVSLLGQGCVLPAGEYELTVQFFGAGPTGLVPFSEEKTRAFSIRAKEQLSYQPPQAISPANGTLFSEPDIIKPITFRWTPVVPRPQEPITYRVKVWQLMQGQNGVQAMRVNQPIITKDVDNLTQTIINNLISGPCLPPYLCDFIWNVQAINREWKPVGGNNGISEALKFTVRPVNDSPSIIALISPANGSTISAKDKPKFTWAFKGIENNYSSGSNQLYKIKIVEIKGNESPDNALRSNKPHFEKDSLKEQSFQYPSSAPSFIAGKKYGWNVSIFDRWGKLQSSTASMFFASSCDVNLILKLRSVECLPDLDRNRRYKINFSSTYSSSTYNLTYIQTGSGLSAYHPSYSPNYSITNISPALQSQNSGVSTTINYSFEVSVPIGQTAIKIGLQGDDKDPGPITCKPGAELDVSLPVCTTTSCDCGEWGTLVIDGRKYECNSRINWTCNKPFQFTSSYTCRTTDANCVAKTTWEVKKGDTLIKSGTGSNTLSDGFSLMANGIYTLTLNANCGDKKCLPCTYTIIVDDCKPVTCDCGTWRPLLINGKSAECGSKIPWNCNKPFDFASTYLCSPNNESCAAKTRWTVSKDGKVIQQGTGTNSIKGSFTPSTNGTYTLTLDANCGEKECKSCTYTIVVEDCRPVLSCVTPPNGMVAWWTFDEKAGQPLVDRAGINNAGTGFYNPLSVPAKVAGGLKFDGINNYVDVPNHAELNFGTGDFSFDAWIQTDDAIGLKDLVDKRTTKGYLIYLVNGKLGFLLRNSSITNYNSPLFVADGKWHHIAITVARENKNGIMFYLDGVPTQLGDPTLQSGNIDNTSPLRIGKDLYSDSYNFKGILDEIELFNRVLTKEEVQTLFAAGSAGKCKDVVPVCDCGTWRPLLINGKSIECGSKIPWNC